MSHAGQDQQPLRRHAPLPERRGQRRDRRPADAPYIGSVLAKVRPSQHSVASYVWLIKCIGDPVFCAPNIATGGYLGTPYAPLFVGTAENNPSMPGFKPRTTCSPRPTCRPRDCRDDASCWTSLNASAGDGRAALEQMAGLAAAQPSSWPSRRTRGGRSTWSWRTPSCATATAGIRWGKTCCWRGGSSRRASASSRSTAGRARPPTRNWAARPARAGTCTAATWAWGTPSGPARTAWAGACRASMRRCRRCWPISRSAACWSERWWCAWASSGARRASSTGSSPAASTGRQCCSAILAGGGIRGGQVYGESDKIGAYVKDRPVRPQDLGATIYHALGVPLDPRLGKDGVSQPLTKGTPLVELFG